MSEELQFHIEQYAERAGALRRFPAGSQTARPHRVRLPEHRSGRVPRGARASPLRRTCQAAAPRRPPAAQNARIHGHRPRDPRRLHRREPHHLRRGGCHPSPPAALPRCRPSRHRFQYVPQGRRGSRRFLHHQLLRTPRPHSRLLRSGPLFASVQPLSAKPAPPNASRSRAYRPNSFRLSAPRQ